MYSERGFEVFKNGLRVFRKEHRLSKKLLSHLTYISRVLFFFHAFGNTHF